MPSVLSRSFLARSLAVAGATLAAAGSARADVVQFKNGDKLTGTVVSAEGGKLKVKSAVAGTVDVSLSDVKTFSTDGEVSLRLEDGKLVRQKVAAADKEGQVTAGGAAVPLKSIRSINQSQEWTGTVVAGALITRGNSDTEAFNVAFDATRRTDVDRFNVNGQYLFGRQRNEDTGDKFTSTDNWRVGGKYDYFFQDPALKNKLYAFASAGVEKDRIAELEWRLTPAVGLGYQWVERPDFNVSTELGVSYVYERFDNDETNDSVGLKLAYHVDKQLREGVKAFHNLVYYPSVEKLSDYLLQTDAGIRVDLTEKFFTEAKVEFRLDSTPASNASRSDLRYILGVGWAF